MSTSTKLSLAVKGLCYLAESYPEPRSSSQISEAIGGNASKIRRLFSLLACDHIVSSTKGAMGGFLISRNPRDIHMQEIYCSIEDKKVFHLDVHKNNGGETDFIARFDSFFLGMFADIQIEIEEKMKQVSIASIMERLNIKNGYSQK